MTAASDRRLRKLETLAFLALVLLNRLILERIRGAT
jgi:hypothetical protein